MKSSIAVVGPGAIGCMTGAALMESGHDVLFCARTAFSRVRLSSGDEAVADLPAHVVTDPRATGARDWVLVCTKVHQTPSAAGWLASTVGPSTRVAVLQNGVEQASNVAPFVPAGTTVVPVVVRLPSRRTDPGVVVFEGRGALVAPDSEGGRAFAALFDGSRIEGAVTSDFATEAYQKLCLNAANGAIMALTERNLDVMRDSRIQDVVRALVRECIAVGRAEGAKLEDSLADKLVQQLATSPRAETRGNSMFYDRMAGREMEWDARNGVIVRLGARHGIETPVSMTLTALLSAVRPHKLRDDC